MQALTAYARTGGDDWRERVQAYKNEVHDPGLRSTIQWRLDPIRIAQHVKETQTAKVPSVSLETRAKLAEAFNGDFNKPGLNSTNSLKRIIQEGEFEQHEMVGPEK